LVSGNYPKANATGTVTDSGVTAGPYATEWITAYRAGTATTFNTSGTKIELWGVTLQFPLNTGTLSYNVSGADATSNTYDLGIYSGAGALVAHTGAIAGSTAMTAGSHSVSWTGTNPKTLEPGKYYLAITTSCVSSCATLSGDGSSAVVTFLSAGTVTTGGTQGTLDSSITAPADAYTWSGSMISFIVR
jgi:flagellar hook assembly protein FlgD